MSDDLPDRPEYRATMRRLEQARRLSESGAEYWFAREISLIFGYETWQKFQPVIGRAKTSMVSNSIEPSHHIIQTGKMMGIGGGATRQGADYFLSRAACYLIAMNGDPSKPEVSAAQAYFAVQTRAQELSEDEKRLQQRAKVTESFKVVSGVAKEAGVSSKMQPLFHDARYRGLYEMSGRSLKRRKGVGEKENLFDRMGALELSANEFQMNLAAETIRDEGIRGEARAINKNQEIARRVRMTMTESGSPPPEELPVAEPIKQVAKRVKAQKKIASGPDS